MRILTLDNKCYKLEHLPDELTDDIRFSVLDNSNPKEPDFFYIPLIFLDFLFIYYLKFKAITIALFLF